MEQPSSGAFHSAARQCGFEISGIASARPSPDLALYDEWVRHGYAGELGYLIDHRADIRRDPAALLPSVRSVLCLGKIYKTVDLADPPVSRYAWGAGDYHNWLRGGLQALVNELRRLWGEFDHRICVDTAPLLERSYARQAGLGWIGRNTCLINQQQGSWLFLGEILVSIELLPDQPPPDRCGSCRRCIDACPTQALVPSGSPSGYSLDARLCISTLTIEQRGSLPEELRPGVGHRLFGCDVCQEVCPWNHRAPSTGDPAFQPVHPHPDLIEMAELTPSDFEAAFRRTPIRRAKYTGWLRNLATAMGNSGDPRYRSCLPRLAAHEDASVAGHARWALGRLDSRPREEQP